MSQTYDVIIVGAGIVGAACAMECARAGLRTLALDRGSLGGGATAAAMGHVVLMDDSEAQFSLTNYSRRLWKEWQPRLPPAVEYQGCGTIWIAADADEMKEVYRKEEYYRKHGARVEVMDAPALAKAEPNLRAGLAGGLLVPDDVVLYPPGAARVFMEQAVAAGAEFRAGAGVEKLLTEGGVQLAGGERVSAGRSVSATGPWSPELTPGLPVRKRKGHLILTERAPGFVRRQLVELGYLKSAHSLEQDSVAFNVQPRLTGQVIIGSSRQFNADGNEIDQAILDRMLRRALEYMPHLGQLPAVRSWAGHRAATPDKLPIIGPSAVSDRIWLATGHEGLGITTSLGTARLLVDLLLGRTPEIPATPFTPGRFSTAKL